MRLDIGADGKIIGTRRVSPNGQVSGLTEYAGREVLVILPGSSDTGGAASWPNVEEVTRLVNDQIRQAYDRYRILQENFATPWEATRSFMQGMFGRPVPDLMAEVDRWVRSQVRAGGSGGTEERPGDDRDGKDEDTRRRRASSSREKPSSRSRSP